MKTVTAPFDLEMARRIQNGEVEGKIVDKREIEYEIAKWDAMGDYPLIGVYFDEKYNTSYARSFTTQGIYNIKKESDSNLQLELPWYLTCKEGQYVTIETKEYTYVFIYKFYLEGTTNPVHYHVFFNTTDKDLHFNSYCDDEFGVKAIRPSTPSEIELMHELLREKGKRWNPETKRVEDVKKEPEHEFKPFDHVLVRDDDEQHWICDFFSNVEEDRTFCCVGGTWHQCIPYEGNEHLVGKQATPEEHED
jgi:hypothetical protein